MFMSIQVLRKVKSFLELQKKNKLLNMLLSTIGRKKYLAPP